MGASCALMHSLRPPCVRDEECCLLKEIAEGTYKTKHAEAARLDYITREVFDRERGFVY